MKKVYIVWVHIDYEGMNTKTLKVCIGDKAMNLYKKELYKKIKLWNDIDETDWTEDKKPIHREFIGDRIECIETEPLT